MPQGDIMEVQRSSMGSSHTHVPLNVEDYVFHGDELDDYSIYELAMTSYCRTTDRATMERCRQRDRPTR